jgi:hypothetical protein
MDCPVVAPFPILASAVERVDDPHMVSVMTLGVVRGLFAEDAVAGKMCADKVIENVL